MKASLLNTLNPDQRSAVETTSGPLLVLAGAGSGKTRVVTYRIAHLIDLGTSPRRILAVTFTNKAAAEMQERVSELIGAGSENQPHISTFHSLCVGILRRHITLLGYPARFAIYATAQQESVARKVLRDLNVPGAQLKPSDLIYFISSWKCQGISPEDAASTAENDREHLAAAGYRRYQGAIKAAGAVDFDDLLLRTQDLFDQFPDVRQAEAALFDHVLVDEYQDTNGTQYRIIRRLAALHRNLCVVGDDDQSIYGWRGAEVEHILRFADDWPNAKVVRLEENYRSTGAILRVANRLIAYNSVRHDKVLRAARGEGQNPQIRQFETETDEAEKVVADLAKRLTEPGVEPRDFAILFRTKEQPRAFETELRKRDLPYVLIGGMSFFDRKEVRDVMAYLRVLHDPTDEISLLRIINTPARNIGEKTIETLTNAAIQRRVPVWEVLSNAQAIAGISTPAAKAIRTFADQIHGLREDLNAGEMVRSAQRMLGEVRYRDELSRIYTDEQEFDSRWAAVEEVINALGEYEQSRRKKKDIGLFLDSMALDGKDQGDKKDKQLRRNSIVLMTLHAAKGLEFPHVYMVGLEEGILPHHRSIKADGPAIEEERRLCYVGITRAQDSLVMSLALSRRKWGRANPTDASRFLFEVTGDSDNIKKRQQANKKRRGPTRKKSNRSSTGRQ